MHKIDLIFLKLTWYNLILKKLACFSYNEIDFYQNHSYRINFTQKKFICQTQLISKPINEHLNPIAQSVAVVTKEIWVAQPAIVITSDRSVNSRSQKIHARKQYLAFHRIMFHFKDFFFTFRTRLGVRQMDGKTC